MEQAVKPEPVAVLLELLTRRKWAPAVILVLDQADGPLRFGEIHKRIERLSEHTLNQTLQSLLRDGLITRKVHDETPSRVDYSNTRLGRSFCVALQPAIDWAEQHLPEVLLARRRFDQSQ